MFKWKVKGFCFMGQNGDVGLYCDVCGKEIEDIDLANVLFLTDTVSEVGDVSEMITVHKGDCDRAYEEIMGRHYYWDDGKALLQSIVSLSRKYKTFRKNKNKEGVISNGEK